MRLKLKEKQNQRNEMFSFFFFYLIITCVVYILPLFKFIVPYMIAGPLMLATLFPFFFKKTPWLTRVFMMCAVFLAIALIGALNGVYSPVDSLNEFVRNIRFFLPILWGCYAIKYTTEKQQKVFLVIFGILVAFILIRTLIALEMDPWISRILAQSKEASSNEVNEYRRQNIGGFEFSYMMGIIALCLTWSALKVKNIPFKVLSILGVLLCFYYIIETMYTTLLLLTFIGVFLLLFLEIKNPIIKGAVVIGAIIMAFSLAPILKFLSTAFDNESLLNTKFENLYLALVNDNLDLVGSRPEKIMHSFQNWIKNPIFGSYDSSSNSHSLVLSTLETGGIVGFIPWFAMFFYGYNLLKKELKEKGVSAKLIFVSFAFVILLSFFNPIGYVFEVTIAAFFIVPIWCNVIANKKELDKNEKSLSSIV